MCAAHATCQELFPYFSLENLGGSEAVGRLSPRRSLPALPGAATPGKGRRDGDLKEGNRLPTAGCRPLRPPARPLRSALLAGTPRAGEPGGRVCGRAQRPGRGAAPTSVVKERSPEPPAAPLPDLGRCWGGGRCCPPLVGGDLGRPCGTALGRASRISSSEERRAGRKHLC